MLSQNNRNNKKSNKESKNNLKIFPKKMNIYDINEYGITKINNKENNNPYKIILLDKKNNNKKYIKKPSFSNLCITGLGQNQDTLGYKETKSENIDESCEKLHNRINGLFFNKINLTKNEKDDDSNNRKNYTLMYKKISNSLEDLNDSEINNKGFSHDKSNIIKPKLILESSNINNINQSLIKIPNGMDDNNNKNLNDDSLTNNSIEKNLKINGLMAQTGDNKDIKEKDKSKIKIRVSRSFTSYQKNFDNDEDSIFQKEKNFNRKNSNIRGIKKK